MDLKGPVSTIDPINAMIFANIKEDIRFTELHPGFDNIQIHLFILVFNTNNIVVVGFVFT